MARSKAPLSERDANAAPKQSATTKKSAKEGAKSSKPNELIDVANIITKTYSKKRSHEKEDDEPEEAKPSPAAKKQKTDKDDTKKNNTKKDNVKKDEAKKAEGVKKSASKSTTKKENGVEKDEKSNKSASKSKSKDKDDKDKYDVSDITLDGEDSGTVPIFDTCNDLRTKINAHLRAPKTTIAGLARMMSKTYEKANEPRGIAGKQISEFLKKKGPRAGATSGVYYAGYVYFEKLRLKQGKPKSKKRTEMEQVHPPTGCDTENDGSRGFLCGPNQRPAEDKYGIVSFIETGPRPNIR